MAEVTGEQIAQEDEFLKGLPRINVGALFLPPIWGPAHGFWVTILFYPIWLFADNMFYAAWTERTPLAIVVALVVFATLTAGTVAFSIIAQPLAAHRAEARGVDRQVYLRRQRVWAVVCVIAGLAMIAGATYYNLVVRPTLGL